VNDHDLEDRLRALRDALPALDVPEAFPDTIRARAHRRAHRTLVAGTAALVAAVAAAVIIPVSLVQGGTPVASSADGTPVSASSAGTTEDPTTYYGQPLFGVVSVSWLPSGTTAIGATTVTGNLGQGQDMSLPPLTRLLGLLDGTSYVRLFTGTPGPATAALTAGSGPAAPAVTSLPATAPGLSVPQVSGASAPASAPVTGPGSAVTIAVAPTSPVTPSSRPASAPAVTEATPAAIWVTVNWRPTTTWVNAVNAGLPASLAGAAVTHPGIDGQPSLALAIGPTALYRQWGDNGDAFGTLLSWIDPTSEAEVTVETAGNAPLDLAITQRIAEGVILGSDPSGGAIGPISVVPLVPASPEPTVAAGSDIDTAVRAAVHDVFTNGVPDAQFAAALQDGQALLDVRHKVEAKFPQLANTVTVTIGGIYQIAPDTAQVSMTLNFTDPTVPTLLNHDFPYHFGTSGTVVRTSAGWQVSRSAYCEPISALGVPAIDCP
jgi:hypothetical protein